MQIKIKNQVFLALNNKLLYIYINSTSFIINLAHAKSINALKILRINLWEKLSCNYKYFIITNMVQEYVSMWKWWFVILSSLRVLISHTSLSIYLLY